MDKEKENIVKSYIIHSDIHGDMITFPMRGYCNQCEKPYNYFVYYPVSTNPKVIMEADLFRPRYDSLCRHKI